MKACTNKRMTHADIELARQTAGASVLLFITDRCPVGCAHCSVDSRPDSPMISDFALFDALLAGIVARPGLEVVGISGGEPFSERRGLGKACKAFADSGKAVVIYTSGVWATREEPVPWVSEVMRTCSTIYLSTDSFHQAGVPTSQLIRAARQIADAGVWMVVQTLEVEQTELLLELALGPDYHQHAEIVPITPLRNGRGQDVFELKPMQKAKAMGSCSLAVTPVVRYDGVVTSCCNEEIIMGKGPDRFRIQVNSREELHQALTGYADDPLMKCVSSVGLGYLTEHPRLQKLAGQRFTNNCDLCWKVANEFQVLPETDRLINAIATLDQFT